MEPMNEKPRARPNKHFLVYLSPEYHARLERVAAAQERTAMQQASYYIRRALGRARDPEPGATAGATD